MIVRHLNDILGTANEVKGENWVSRRFLLKSDGMGFSMSDTLLEAGSTIKIWYKNHLEAVYVIEGTAELTVEGGESYSLSPGSFYALDKHDKHSLKVLTPFRAVCVFNPPLSGEEVHDKDGAYPAND